MKVLETLDNPEFPLKWANTEYLRENSSPRKEIYLKDSEDIQNDLIYLFYKLFGDCKEQLLVYDKLWWELCLGVWNISTDTYDLEVDSKPEDCRAYLSMLMESDVPKGYSGCCKCNSWDTFLPIVLSCIISGEAPYSPLFVDAKDEFFFYFHHSGSIGMYYKTGEDRNVQRILKTAFELYEVLD
jgi:hypothetical protein